MKKNISGERLGVTSATYVVDIFSVADGCITSEGVMIGGGGVGATVFVGGGFCGASVFDVGFAGGGVFETGGGLLGAGCVAVDE